MTIRLLPLFCFIVGAAASTIVLVESARPGPISMVGLTCPGCVTVSCDDCSEGVVNCLPPNNELSQVSVCNYGNLDTITCITGRKVCTNKGCTQPTQFSMSFYCSTNHRETVVYLQVCCDLNV